MSKPEGTIGTLPECPYCGRVEDDYHEIKDGEWECPACGKKSDVTVHTTFQLEPIEESAEKKEAPSEGEHEGAAGR